MSDIVEKMRQRILEIADPNNPYTMEDFDKEFKQTNAMADYKLQINFVNKSNNPNPEYATNGASGFDLRANLTDPMVIPAGKRGIVPTGLFFELPENMEIQVRPRSGLAAKNGVTVLNSPGTIDSDYRGEIMVILINHDSNDFVINHGDRIAQAVVASVLSKNTINLINTETLLSETERGEGRFGSTGK